MLTKEQEAERNNRNEGWQLQGELKALSARAERLRFDGCLEILTAPVIAIKAEYVCKDSLRPNPHLDLLRITLHIGNEDEGAHNLPYQEPKAAVEIRIKDLIEPFFSGWYTTVRLRLAAEPFAHGSMGENPERGRRSRP